MEARGRVRDKDGAMPANPFCGTQLRGVPSKKEEKKMAEDGRPPLSSTLGSFSLLFPQL